VATDASPEQIARTAPHPKVEYRCARAEASGLTGRVVDLATAAQAAHWFDLPAYYAEVRRLPGPAGSSPWSATVCWSGRRPRPDHPAFYRHVLASYWPPERRHVDEGYRSLPFPFEELEAPALEIRLDWRLAELVGYVGTWSAVVGARASER